jgi:hypothetical protein
MSLRRQTVRRCFKRIAPAAALVAIVAHPALALASTGTKYATSATITADQATPHFGDHVTFTVALNGPIPANTVLDIAQNCYQGSAWKYQFVDPSPQTLDAGFGWPIGGIGTSWSSDNGHTSSCTASAFYYWTKGHTSGRVDLGSTTFAVACAVTDAVCTSP